MNVCRMGREKRDGRHPACLSCQKQDVPCPFPCLTGKKAAKGEISSPDQIDVSAKEKKKPNKTEAAYGRRLELEYPDADVVFEPFRLNLANGHGYSPDWVVFSRQDGAIILLVETKGVGKDGFKHGSYQRAKCMFDQSKVDFPFWKWRWAEKRGTTWTVTE